MFEAPVHPPLSIWNLGDGDKPDPKQNRILDSICGIQTYRRNLVSSEYGGRCLMASDGEYVTRLNAIAIDAAGSKRSLFLRSLANAWLYADPENKRILRQAWAKVIIKYGLGEGGP